VPGESYRLTGDVQGVVHNDPRADVVIARIGDRAAARQKVMAALTDYLQGRGQFTMEPIKYAEPLKKVKVDGKDVRNKNQLRGQALLMAFKQLFFGKQPKKRTGFHVAPSKIHGKGIFTDTALSIGDDLGLALVRRDHARPGEPAFWRTILGRYLNHSDTPNAELYHVGDGLIHCRAIMPIDKGDEVTLDYRHGMQLQRDVWREKEAYATGGGDAAGAGQSAVIPNRLVDGSGTTPAGPENQPTQIDEEKIRQAEMPVDENMFDLSLIKQSDLLDEIGASADTYHKRIAVPRSLLTEEKLKQYGFEPVLIAVPEAGQTEFFSYRNPKNLYHIHPHGDYFTIHRDRHPSMTMSVRQAKGLTEKAQAVASGLAHVATEGVPGAWAYIRNKIMSALSDDDQAASKFHSPFLNRMEQENPASILKAPPRLLRWLPPWRKNLDFLGEPDPKMASANAWTEGDVVGTDQGVEVNPKINRAQSLPAESYQDSGTDEAQGKSKKPTGAGILERGGGYGSTAGPMSAPPVVRGETEVTGSSTPMTGQKHMFGYG